MIFELHKGFKAVEPDFIVSRPEASIYFVIDVRKVAKPGFDGVEFASWCAEHGAVSLDDGKEYTLLMAPLNGFYSGKKVKIIQVEHNCAYPSVKIQTYCAWLLNYYLNYSELTSTTMKSIILIKGAIPKGKAFLADYYYHQYC